MSEDYGLLANDEVEGVGDEWSTIDVADTEADEIARTRDREFAQFRERIKDADQFKVEASVFDDATFGALYKLVQDGYIQAFGGPISTGKEANVYTALAGSTGAPEAGTDEPNELNEPTRGDEPADESDGDDRSEPAGEDEPAGKDGPASEGSESGADPATGDGSSKHSGQAPASDQSRTEQQAPAEPTTGADRTVAVKIYRINASDFRDMRGYLEGDPRFEGLGSDKKAVVTAWVRKEYANLERARAAGVRTPRPIAVERNVLVMEYIDTDRGRARRLNEVDVENPETAFEVVREYMRRLFDAGLVHGDLSEYNVVVQDGELVVIDLGQAVTVHHGNAGSYLRRDCENVANYFHRLGVDTTPEALYDWVVGEADRDGDAVA